MTPKDRKNRKSQISKITELANQMPSAPRPAKVKKEVRIPIATSETKILVKKGVTPGYIYLPGQPHSNNF